ncbi:hypothetical protein [Shewanella nanhaiensis]|uniref:DUF2946 domain-containing protein n=1 Tax=Shewanella nanhaiensis TaxID=2864872 RepID=A0ABS7DZB2_9GAMM|nr:hypothetical protein [Shewanella nanhaiensis]MBW8182751.1 hypothetical protein [Shewanella nanhaiensis]
MVKQIIHLLLFIALVGQNLMSPAMAMPEFIHSMNHKATQQTSSVSLVISPVETTAEAFSDGQIVQCDQPCMILASGHCVAHCTLLTGIVAYSSLDLIQIISSEPIPNRSWSILTTEPIPTIRPPIA